MTVKKMRRTTWITALTIAVAVSGLASATPQIPAGAAGWSGIHAALPAPDSPAVILWDQTDNVGTNGFPSQNFEASFNAFDNQGADNFTVPAATTWSIDTVRVLGSYSAGGGPVPNVDVLIYSDTAGLPGAQVYSALAVVPSADAAGDLTIPLAAPAVLGAGQYWISVIANMNFSPTGQWFWSTRTVANAPPYAWRNPGNGFGTGCITWSSGAATCGVGGGVEPDALFRLDGTIVGGGGTCSDYNVATSVGQAIVPGTTDTGNHCDDCSTNIALPFSFSFYGASFNSANVVSNGSLQFSSTNTSFSNVCLPVAAMNNAIIPYWDDLRTDAGAGCAGYPGGTCGIYTSTTGVAPNRIFNIEWRATYFTGGAAANFEVRLYETTGQIDFIYASVSGGNASATGGLQQGTGPTVEPFFCNGAGQALSTGLRGAFTCAGGACTIIPPADITQGNDLNQCGAVVNYPAPGGTCTGVTCAPASGSFFPVGTTTVTCTNATGGTSATFDVTVNDTQPPSVVTPNPVVPNDPGLCSAVVPYTPGAADNCPGVTAACVPPSGSTFPVGVTPISCTATDAAGNTATAPGSVTVNDVEVPTITCPADIELELPPGSPGQNVDYDPPVTGDNCPGETYDCQPPSGDWFPAGQTAVNCTALDASGNTATCAFNVILGAVSVLEVPTVSTLGLLALALLLAAAAFVVLRRNG